MIHNKREYMTRERRDMPLVSKWLSSLGISHLRDSSYEQQIKGIDKVNGETYEIKIRYQPQYLTKDILIEELSKKESGTHGWIEYCTADNLVYVFIDKGKVIGGHIFDRPALKRWWDLKGKYKAFRIRESKNQGYTTVNRQVPLRMIPRAIYKHSTVIYHLSP